MKWTTLSVVGGAFLILAYVAPARGATIVHLSFEQELDANGDPVPTAAGNAVRGTGAAVPGAIIDSAAGDDNFAAFNPNSGNVYSSDVPLPVIPQTGAANLRSLSITPNNDVYSPNAAGPARSKDLDNFTIEAYYR